MKRFLIVCICVLCFICSNPAIAKYDEIVHAYFDDIVPVYLTEYIDGKPTGNVMQFELHVMGTEKKPRWVLTTIIISTDDYDETETLQTLQVSSDEVTDLPWVQKLKWIPGKNIDCVLLPEGDESVVFTATKIKGTTYDWNLSCVGVIKGAVTNGETKKWEWKASKDTVLKYKKLRFVSLYSSKN